MPSSCSEARSGQGQSRSVFLFSPVLFLVWGLPETGTSDTFVSVPTDGCTVWYDEDTWDEGEVPGENDDVIISPGHTVGGQSVAVNTSEGRAVITGFCCNDKNFPTTGPAIAPGVHIDLTEAYDSIQKIREMADILIPLHDPVVGTRKTIP